MKTNFLKTWLKTTITCILLMNPQDCQGFVWSQTWLILLKDWALELSGGSLTPMSGAWSETYRAGAGTVRDPVSTGALGQPYFLHGSFGFLCHTSSERNTQKLWLSFWSHTALFSALPLGRRSCYIGWPWLNVGRTWNLPPRGRVSMLHCKKSTWAGIYPGATIFGKWNLQHHTY